MDDTSSIRAALKSINYNGSNYRVISFFVLMSFVIGLSFIGGTLITFQASDQDPSLTTTTTIALIITDIVALVFIFLAYTTYIRNVGSYIYSRLKQPIK